MKINQSRNRRMFIMEQISLRQHSRQQSRKSSAQRRKKVQQSLTNFMKTMTDVPYDKTGGSQAFKIDHSISQQNYYSQLNDHDKQVRNQQNAILRSPSFKDINILEEQKVDDMVMRQQKRSRQQQLDLQREDNIQDEQIVYRQVMKEEEKLVQNSVMGNESSASAIFFTSQFNEFITKNHLQPNTQSNNHFQPNTQPNNHLYPNNENITKEQPLTNSQMNNIQSLKHNQPQIQFSYPNQLQTQQPITQTHNQQSNQQQIVYPLEGNPSQLKQLQQQKQYHQQQTNLLIKNKSNQSLVFSNQSSLKYSLNQSNIKHIINQKFTHQLIAHTNQFQLIAQTNQFDLNNQNSSLLFHLKFQILVDKFHLHSNKTTLKQFCSLSKLYQLSKKVIKRLKTTAFQAFIINQQLNLLNKKNQIKCQNFLKQKQEQKFNRIFQTLKQLFFIQPLQKLQKAKSYQSQKQNQKKQKIFRCFKIAWFDQKVKKQIELYYLSKLFTHFTRVIKKQKQTQRKKYLSFYCFNLKKRFFNSLKQGVENIQTQRIQRENANCHYSFGLIRKVFDAWKQKLSYKDRYISLAMTTKNTFKETSDQRWMQIKTVDFRQIK